MIWEILEIFSALRRLSGCIARRLASMGKRWDTGDHVSINGYTHGEKTPTPIMGLSNRVVYRVVYKAVYRQLKVL